MWHPLKQSHCYFIKLWLVMMRLSFHAFSPSGIFRNPPPPPRGLKYSLLAYLICLCALKSWVNNCEDIKNMESCQKDPETNKYMA